MELQGAPRLVRFDCILINGKIQLKHFGQGWGHGKRESWSKFWHRGEGTSATRRSPPGPSLPTSSDCSLHPPPLPDCELPPQPRDPACCQAETAGPRSDPRSHGRHTHFWKRVGRRLCYTLRLVSLDEAAALFSAWSLFSECHMMNSSLYRTDDNLLSKTRHPSIKVNCCLSGNKCHGNSPVSPALS